jgi:hypothetical protein
LSRLPAFLRLENTAVTYGDELTAVVAALCFWADRGDEQSALDLNQLAETYPPEVMLAASKLKADPLFQPRCAEWELLGATVDLIAAHYGATASDTWGAVFEAERELLADCECDSLSNLLQSPDGILIFELAVAGKLRRHELGVL